MPNQEKCLAFFPIGGDNTKKRNKSRKTRTPIAGKEKVCALCGRVKIMESFFDENDSTHEYKSCRKCREDYRERWRVNKDKNKERRKKHYREHRDEILEKKKRYKEENPEKIKEIKKRYYEKNKERIKERAKEAQKKYYENNKEQIKERKRAHYHKKKAEGLANDE